MSSEIRPGWVIQPYDVRPDHRMVLCDICGACPDDPGVPWPIINEWIIRHVAEKGHREFVQVTRFLSACPPEGDVEESSEPDQAGHP
ncbi:hypothetical protein CTZ27_03260 [Streptomyces griseocarneus]|nr:hypothetical protein CTZ27_03260 [Streptomyces griseocarneus]